MAALCYLVVLWMGKLRSDLFLQLALVPLWGEGGAHLLFLVTLQCVLEAAELSLQSPALPRHTVQLSPQGTDVALEERLHVALTTSLLLHEVPLGLQQLVFLLQEPNLPQERVSPCRKDQETMLPNHETNTQRMRLLFVSFTLGTLEDSHLLSVVHVGVERVLLSSAWAVCTLSGWPFGSPMTGTTPPPLVRLSLP